MRIAGPYRGSSLIGDTHKVMAKKERCVRAEVWNLVPRDDRVHRPPGIFGQIHACSPASKLVRIKAHARLLCQSCHWKTPILRTDERMNTSRVRQTALDLPP